MLILGVQLRIFLISHSPRQEVPSNDINLGFKSAFP